MKRVVLAVVVCTFVAAPAFADLYGTVRVEHMGLIRGMDLSIASSVSGVQVETVEDVGLHQLQFTNLSLGGAGTVPIPTDSYLSAGSTAGFCIDMWDNFPVGPDAPYLYNVVSLDVAPDPAAALAGGMGPGKAGFIAELLAKNPYGTAQQAAALQVAIWEIIDENHWLFPAGGNPWNVSSGQGNFYLDTVNGTHGEAAIAGLANTMLGELTTGLPFDRYTALSNGPGSKNVQDFVVVPVPAAFLLGMFGLSVAGVKLRRFA